MNNPNFSQRYGYEPLPEAMQLESISEDLRREIWNVIRRFLTDMTRAGFGDAYFDERGEHFVERTVGKLTKKSEDEILTGVPKAFGFFKHFVLNGSFNQVLDIIDVIVNDSTGSNIAGELKNLFETHAAPYWLNTSCSPFFFVPRNTKEEGEAIQNALTTIEKSNMKGTNTHLRQAIEHINAQRYPAAVTDSIHAVESVAKQIDPKKNKTLGPALNSLKQAGIIKHSQIKNAFQHLYGYTNEEQGGRHSLWTKDKSDIGLDEAMLMFGACASFAAYLTKKHQQTKNQEGDST